MRTKKYNILELQQNREEWSLIKTDLWSSSKRDIFDKRKLAVDMYIDDFSAKEIYENTGINHDKVAKLVTRCLKINPETNTQYGYIALIPNIKINKAISTQINKNISKSKGSFNSLLVSYPSLEIFIRDAYFKKANATLEKRITPANLHKKFLEECKKLKIQDYEYPFNTKDKAQRTFYLYLKKLDNEYPNFSITRENENAKQKFFSTGIGKSIRPIHLTPFSVIQIDGHRIDMLYTVEVRNKHGEIIRMPAMRMWLIAVIDVATRTILGYR